MHIKYEVVGYEKPDKILHLEKCYKYAKVYNFTLHRIYSSFRCCWWKLCRSLSAIDAEVITFHVDRLDKTLPNDVYRDMITYQHIRTNVKVCFFFLFGFLN